MNKADHLKPWLWRPGQSGNLAGRKPKPRRSLNAVQRLEALGVDPLEEVVTLAKDPALPKATRLKAWMALMDFAYPRLAPVTPSETVTATLEEQQRAWNTETLEEFFQAFQKELDTLPEEAKAGIKKLEAMGKIGPILMQSLIKFVERRHEQKQAPIPEEPEPLKLAAG
jgi:hypothetical protein